MGSSFEVRCDFQRMKNGARREAVGGTALHSRSHSAYQLSKCRFSFYVGVFLVVTDLRIQARPLQNPPVFSILGAATYGGQTIPFSSLGNCFGSIG